MPQAAGQLHRETLGRLLAVSRHLSASSDLRDILNVIIDAMRDTLDADRATVFEYDAASDELVTNVAHGVEEGKVSGVRCQVSDTTALKAGGVEKLMRAVGSPSLSPDTRHLTPASTIRIPATAGLAGECAQRKQIINTPDAYADARFNQSVDRKTGYRTRSILTIPLLDDEGGLVGVAQVLNKREVGAFTAEDEEIAEALAAQAAVAMRRGRLLEDRLVKQQLERDIELARTIQQSSFPTELPAMKRFDIAAWNLPADQTGGDVYDVWLRRGDANEHREVANADSRSPNVVLLMADATGHGVGPAISVTQLRSMLRMGVRLNATLNELAQHANEQLCADLPGGRFITAWFGELDDVAGTLDILSAGQAPLLLYRAAADEWESRSADTVPLGVLDDASFPDPARLRLDAGDLFAVVSDGIFEAVNGSLEQFGVERAQAAMRAARGGSAKAIIDALRQALDDFTGPGPRLDDCTVIVIKGR
jgi:phosphoserine phosphatase RsbU/P